MADRFLGAVAGNAAGAGRGDYRYGDRAHRVLGHVRSDWRWRAGRPGRALWISTVQRACDGHYGCDPGCPGATGAGNRRSVGCATELEVAFQRPVDRGLGCSAFIVERSPGVPIDFVETDVMQGFVELGAKQSKDGLLPLHPGLLPLFAESEHRFIPAAKTTNNKKHQGDADAK